MDDKAFISALLSGGTQAEKAIQSFFDQHKGMIGDAIKRHQLTETECLDAYTDAIIGMRRQILRGKFEGKSKLSTYFYKIYYFKCVDLIRDKSTKSEVVVEEFPDTEDERPIASDTLQTREAFQALLAYMEKLGKQCKEILMYRYYWGYEDMAEIAHILGIKNANTAGSLRYRCMKQLMKIVHG
ncbi:MAG: sigma-70 family RNA polymerase sigma factor [Bacteroidota bacterium]